MIPTFEIPPVELPQTYLDTALARGAKRGRMVKKPHDLRMKVLIGETERLKEIRSSLCGSLSHVHDGFPSFDRLSEFTQRVFSLDLDIGRVRRALASIASANRTIEMLTREHLARMRTIRNETDAVRIRTMYLGRVSSVIRGIADPLELLRQARDIFRSMPTLDDDLFTVAIAGFPNVGKSTLLSKLTPAKPEIKPYAFTTKGLNVGSFDFRYNKIQVVDTPGTLDRETPNPIERKADMTLRYLAGCVVYVFDPTEAGYSLAKQRRLYEKAKELDKPMIVYISKTDVVDKKTTAKLLGEFPGACVDAAEVKKRITAAFRYERVD